VYTDDAVSGLDSRFVQPSWNLRSLYSELRNQSNQPIWGRYPLRTRTLTAGTAEVLNVRAGSAAYLRFAVAGGGAGEVLLTDGGAGPNPAVKFTLVRTR
jgi:hypothetical protein